MTNINYADEATLLWEDHRVLKDLISERTKANRERAEDEADRDMVNMGKSLDRAVIVAHRLKALNDDDILRKNMIDEDQFIREQAHQLSNLALMHDHEPTIRPEEALDRAKKKRGV